MNNFKVEVGEESSDSICMCCQKQSHNGHGFIYKNNDAYSIYYAGWSEQHNRKTVNFALAIGEWDDSSTTDQRTCIGIEAESVDEKILFRLLDPEQSPWPNTELMGEMISREEAKSHGLIEEFFNILEMIIKNHSSISNYLEYTERQFFYH